MKWVLEDTLVDHAADLGPDLEEESTMIFVLELHAFDFDLDCAKFIFFRISHALGQLIEF